MSQIQLVVALHLHMPPGAGAPGWKTCWTHLVAPTLSLLKKHKGVSVALHLSGTILHWLVREHPAALRVTRDLVAKGRIEVLAGGWTDCFLSGVPARDALDQLGLQSRVLQGRAGAKPRGAVLAAGAWDPDLPEILHRAGLEFVFVPGQVVSASLGTDAPDRAHYRTERNGNPVTVIPTDPTVGPMLRAGDWLGATGALDTMRRAGTSAVSVAANVQQLAQGHSPAAYAAWLQGLFRCLDTHAHWLRTCLPSKMLEREPGGGLVYLPSWVPVQLAEAATGRPASTLNPLGGVYDRGGRWESLLVRYPEANRLHKRMLQASLEVSRLRSKAKRSKNRDMARAAEQASMTLFSAQEGSVYWPGSQGGLYHRDARAEVWRALHEAEFVVSRAMGEAKTVRTLRTDLYCDGHEEVLIRTPSMSALVCTSGGAITELALHGGVNLLDVLSRRREPWHVDVEPFRNLPALVIGDDEITDPSGVEDPDTDVGASTFDTTSVPPLGLGDEESSNLGALLDDDSVSLTREEAIQGDALAHLLGFDRAGLTGFQDHFLGPQTNLANLAKGAFPEEGDFAEGRYSLLSVERDADDSVAVLMSREGRVRGTEMIQVRKRLLFLSSEPIVQVRYEVVNRTARPFEGTFAVRLPVAVGPKARVDMGSVEGRVSRWLEGYRVDQVRWTEPRKGLDLRLELEHPGRALHFPIQTVSRSGTGLWAGWQGVCLVVAWPVKLWGEERQALNLSLSLEP